MKGVDYNRTEKALHALYIFESVGLIHYHEAFMQFESKINISLQGNCIISYKQCMVAECHL